MPMHISPKKVVLITAASRGMGAACARYLHTQGYALALVATSADVEKLGQELGALWLRGSVTSNADLETFVNKALATYGRIDGVINNTGHPPKGDLLSIDDAAWHQALDLVILNVVRMARLVVPSMLKQGGGSIVNISTAAAREPSLDFPVSSSLRSGLSAFTRLFAERYGAKNIRMNSILPGMVDSYPESAEILKRIPMGRYARTEEIAKTVGFLLGDDSSYVTGQNIVIDGGLIKAV